MSVPPPDAGEARSGGEDGGEAGTDAGDAGDRPPGAGFVTCGSSTCSLEEDELCCRSGSGDESLSCTTSVSGCDSRIHCDADNDCPESQVCCVEGTHNTTRTFSCQAACSATHLECSGPLDCPEGQLCCGDNLPNRVAGVIVSSTYERVECRSSCGEDEEKREFVFCKTSDDCPDPATSCQPSQRSNLLGLTVCR